MEECVVTIFNVKASSENRHVPQKNSVIGVTTQRLFIVHSIAHYYKGWNFNFGNTPLDWIQELLE